MLSKELLKKEFSKEHKKYYEVPLFKREGFTRKECGKCGKGFWSIGDSRNCGDSSHEKYSFFKEKPRKIHYAEFLKKFLDFWKKNDHEIIPRYPVVCKWRDDLPFNIASIVDFQRLEGGKVVFEYPANPLMVPQVCLRFPDIANIGVTGRHLSCFVMGGQTAFKQGREGYWKDECLEYNYKALRQVMEIPKEKIVYAEDLWSLPDLSAFGPSIECFTDGIELVNNVFTQYRAVEKGFEELEMKVIDVGWGLERLLWYYTGEKTIYDAAFPYAIDYMKAESSVEFEEELMKRYAEMSAGLDVETTLNLREEKEKIAKELGISLQELNKKIAPRQAMYAIGDHSRALLFALNDGALPSNATGGYNLRVLARRAFSFISEYEFNFGLMDLIALHARELKPVFPELEENLDEIQEIIEVEKRKYSESLEKASRIAGEIVVKGEKLSTEKMVTLYESSGITPEILEKAAAQRNTSISIPSEFYSKLTGKHVMEKKRNEEWGEPDEEKKIMEKLLEFPETKPVYYDKQWTYELDAKVLYFDEKHGFAVLDQTIFYPEGGGQMYDLGTINGIKVVNVQKAHSRILHYLEKGKTLKKSEKVKLLVNERRRDAITKHHTATHMMIATCRNVLGKHVWQCGSKKDEEEAHVDITHYEKLSRNQKENIEREVNKKVIEALPVSWKEWDRGEAERKHGFRLYQGGGAIGKRIRVVEIKGLDVEACGGLHRRNTSELGLVKITKVEQVQDGVLRIYYKAGEKAIEYVQGQEAMLEDAGSELSVQKDELQNAIKRIFGEWREKGKELEQMQEQIAEIYSVELAKGSTAKKEGVVEKNVGQLPGKLVEKIALEIAENHPEQCACISNSEGFIAIACGERSGKNAVELLKQKNARGGGNSQFARGKTNA